MSASADVAVALAEGVRRWRRRRALRWGSVLAVVVLAACGAGVTWSFVDARERALAARALTAVQQEAVADAYAATGDLSARIADARAALTDAQSRWDAAVAANDAFRAEAAQPTVSAPNPGGGAMPGGDEQARALLEGIGGADVQIVYDGGPQNCGYAAADALYATALGGCYSSAFRTSVFLAWDPPATRDEVWPIFVHEAMHWYQWDRFFTQFVAAENAGVPGESYRAQIEADASCRAVLQHGVPASAFETSSAPCDVEGWHEGWLVEQLAALGAPVAAPDPETYQVSEVIRP